MNGIPEHVRDLLVCPVCRGELIDTPKTLDCPTCALSYPVVEGVPHLLRELAKAKRTSTPR